MHKTPLRPLTVLPVTQMLNLTGCLPAGLLWATRRKEASSGSNSVIRSCNDKEGYSKKVQAHLAGIAGADASYPARPLNLIHFTSDRIGH